MNSDISKGYDPVLLFHWLWWRVRCLEAGGEAFEALFTKVVERAADDFVPVRPYGNIGDRKCDGLLWGDGVIYQVYSPDEIKQADTVAKMKEDLEGAVEQWGDELKEWVFVYNVRRGLPPDVVQTLQSFRRNYPNIKIDHLSDSKIWDIVEQLPLQARCEILGAPAGFEQAFLMPSALPEEVRARLVEGRFVVIHDPMTPINTLDAVQAMEPENPFGPPYRVRPSLVESWAAAAAYQEKMVDEAIRKSEDLLPRFAVFSLSPIPLAIHLGYQLSDRVEVRLFQYDRDRQTWAWHSDRERAASHFIVEGLPEESISGCVEAVVRVSLSARVTSVDTDAVVQAPLQVDLRVEEPDVTWLRHPDQLVELGRAFRGLLGSLNRSVPQCARIHLFYAGPTGGAIVLGQAINPRMNPPITLYEYDRRRKPRYEEVLTLG